MANRAQNARSAPETQTRSGLITYYYICDEEPITERLPATLHSSLLRIAVEGPKTLRQMIYPMRWFRFAVSHGMFPPKQFWVNYSQHLPELVERLDDEAQVAVLLIHTANPGVLESLRAVSAPFFVLSDLEPVDQLLAQDTFFRRRHCRSVDALLRGLRRIAPFVLMETKREVEAAVRTQKTSARNLVRRDRIVFPPFRACRNNFAVFKNLVDPVHLVPIAQPVVPHNTRPQALARSVDMIFRLHRVLLDFEVNDVGFWRHLPGLVLIAPSRDPWLKRQYLRRLQEMGAVERRVVREFIQLSFAEQKLDDYNIDVPLSYNAGMAEAAKLVTLGKVQFLDMAGGLHASFEDAPCFRAPLRGASLNEHLAPFNPRNYSRRQRHTSVFAAIANAGTEIARGLPSELKALVPVPAHRIVALSDLPVEWTMIDGEPLAFLTDLCRLPESGITSLLSQYSRNLVFHYVVRPDILTSTLVVCGAPTGDAIFARFQNARELAQRHGLPVRFEHCTNREAFLALVRTARPQLLIVDTHGSFSENEVSSVLQFGEEWLSGHDVAALEATPPLVFLSCCWGAPVYGCANTIAQAFFEAGSLSVTTTFLPVGVDDGMLLYFRLLNNLSTAAKTNLHRDWSSFISHLLRTSYFYACADRVREALGRECIARDDYDQVYTEWATHSMYPPDRRGLFTSTFARIVELVSEDQRARARDILERRDFLPEFLFYTTLGRADLVLFDVFRRESFLPLAAT